MNRTLRVLRIAGLGLAALLVVALGLVYGLSQRQLSRSYADVPLSAFRAGDTGDVALVAEGERLARIRGCFGCHGEQLEGRVFVDEPWIARIVAPNLYYHLSDDDLAAVVAYLRALEPRDGLPLEVKVRLLGRVAIAMGEIRPITDEIDPAAPRMASDRADPVTFGRYLAMTSCTECHGAGLEGDDTPDLRIVAAYTPEQFAKLMRTGLALGDRDTGFMSGVARERFSHFTGDEIAALHAYLRQRAAE
jgi:mono/diheme cytochrome c family protein